LPTLSARIALTKLRVSGLKNILIYEGLMLLRRGLKMSKENSSGSGKESQVPKVPSVDEYFRFPIVFGFG
jgi:hypothetical protein